MKKRLLAGGLAVVMVLTAGCSLPPADKQTEAAKARSGETSIVTEPTEVNFMFADGDETGKTVWTKLVRRFNENYEDITVNILPGNGVSYNELLKTKDSIGEFPDILETGNVAAYIRAGKLAPLPDDIVSLFVSPLEFDGKVYTAACSSANTCGIIYNKEYFEKNDLHEPESYHEFIELCQSIQDLGDMSPLVVGGQDVWHMGFWFDKAFSDQVLSRDTDFIKHCYRGEKDFTDESFKAVFKELMQIFPYAQEGWSSTPDAQVTSYLVEDRAAMVYSGTHTISALKKANQDFEPGWFSIPSPDGKIRLVGGNVADGLAISAEAAKNPNNKAAAEEFIRFFFEEENYRDYCETINVMIPTTKRAMEFDVSPVLREVREAISNSDSLDVMWNNRIGENELPSDFRDFTYVTLIEVLEGEKDIDSACAEINQLWQFCIDGFNPTAGKECKR